MSFQEYTLYISFPYIITLFSVFLSARKGQNVPKVSWKLIEIINNDVFHDYRHS